MEAGAFALRQYLARGNEADFQCLRLDDHARDMAFDQLAGTLDRWVKRSSQPGIVTPLRACGPAGGSVAKGMKKISYRGYRFPPEIIQQAIWLYLRFTLSLRDVEDLLAERGIMVSYSY